MMIKCAQAGRILRVLMLTIRGDSALPKSSAPAADATSYRSERKARSALDHFDGRLQAACRWQSFNDDQDSRPDPFATSHRNNLPFRQAAGGTCPSATHARVPAGAPEEFAAPLATDFHVPRCPPRYPEPRVARRVRVRARRFERSRTESGLASNHGCLIVALECSLRWSTRRSPTTLWHGRSRGSSPATASR